MRIYLDYAASTPVAPEVFDAMKPFFFEKWGNASSLHSFGREAEIALDESRETLSRFFNVEFGEVYFTSGATEANNWIVRQALSFKLQAPSMKPHIITSTIEHESLLESVKVLEEKGLIEATYLKPSREGVINPEEVKRALKENTALVSIMYVNNEIGVIQSIREIGNVIRAFRTKRLCLRSASPVGKSGYSEKLTANRFPLYPVFHTDAVQAIQFLESRFDYLNIDAMTVSSHKIYGPKGIGALIAKKSVSLSPFLYGGGQESQKRSGTENIPAIVGFAKAIESINDNDYRIKESTRLSDLKKHLIHGIMKSIPNAIVIGKESIAPHIVSIIFPDVESQLFLIGLDQEGIEVSSGSACSIKAMKPSYVLQSLGYSQKEALYALRFSLGRYTTKKDIESTVQIVDKTFKKLTAKH